MKIKPIVLWIALIAFITGAVASLYAVLYLLEFGRISSGLWMFSIFLFLSTAVVVWMVISSGRSKVTKIFVSGITIVIAIVACFYIVFGISILTGFGGGYLGADMREQWSYGSCVKDKRDGKDISKYGYQDSCPPYPSWLPSNSNLATRLCQVRVNHLNYAKRAYGFNEDLIEEMTDTVRQDCSHTDVEIEKLEGYEP